MLTLVVALGQMSPSIAEIEAAQTQLDDGDYEDVLATTARGLARPELTDEQLAELYRLEGLAHLYLGNEDRARLAFEKLLQARPDYEIPKTAPPKVKGLYARIKEDIKKRRVRPVTLSLEPVGAVEPDAPLVVRARIDDLALGSKAKLFFRRAGAQAYSSVDFRRRGEQFEATVPAFEVEGSALEYFVEVADAAQRRLAGRGDAYNPLVVSVVARAAEPAVAAQERHWYQIPWVWVGVGVGVAAITTTAVVLATQKQTATVQVDVMVKVQ
jgi:hypothetical protein